MKKMFFIIVPVFLASFIAQEGYKPVSDLKSLEKKINIASANTETIKSDFVQMKHLEYLDAVIESKGKFWFKKDNKLRWEYITPFKYTIIINNSLFTFSDDGDISEYDTKSNSAFKEINNLIVNSVNGNILADNKFLVEAFENSDTYLIKLIPKNENMKKVISSIEIVFDNKDYTVSEITMKENDLDYTVIKFANKRLNEVVSEDYFIIK